MSEFLLAGIKPVLKEWEYGMTLVLAKYSQDVVKGNDIIGFMRELFKQQRAEVIEAVKKKKESLFRCRCKGVGFDSFKMGWVDAVPVEELDKMKGGDNTKCPKCNGKKYDSVNGIDGQVVCPQCNGRG